MRTKSLPYHELNIDRPWARVFHLATTAERSEYWRKKVEWNCTLVLTDKRSIDFFIDGGCPIAASGHEHLATSQGSEFLGDWHAPVQTTRGSPNAPGTGKRAQIKQTAAQKRANAKAKAAARAPATPSGKARCHNVTAGKYTANRAGKQL